MEEPARQNILARLTLLTTLACLSAGTVGCARNFTIRSEPSEADVSLNDAPVGKTPLTIPFANLPNTSSLRLQVKKDGFGAFQGILPGQNSAALSSDILVAIPKTDDDSDKFNQIMATILKAQQLASQKRENDALKMTDDALKDHPRFAALHLVRASILFLSKNYTGSLTAYQKVLELDGTNPEAAKMIEYFKKRSLAGQGSGGGRP
jgi:tetratricopeptide (TPR) repeat protein